MKPSIIIRKNNTGFYMGNRLRYSTHPVWCNCIDYAIVFNSIVEAKKTIEKFDLDAYACKLEDAKSISIDEECFSK